MLLLCAWWCAKGCCFLVGRVNRSSWSCCLRWCCCCCLPLGWITVEEENEESEERDADDGDVGRSDEGSRREGDNTRPLLLLLLQETATSCD